jgi:CO dehydrogenase/acetyl-CoA synthase beta subunit
MTAFDDHIRQVTDFVATMRAQGRPVRQFALPPGANDLRAGLPIQVGAGANPRIILRSETFVELGNPDAGSCGFGLWTENPSLLEDGRVTLVGPDIAESPLGSLPLGLPLGQVVMVGGAGLTGDDQPALGQAQIVADQIEGYMVRSSSRNIWSRVSKHVGARGFSFATLARALMFLIKSAVPGVEAVEITFVTSSKGDVLALNKIAESAQTIGRAALKEHWKARGYDLDCDLHCGSCHDKTVCDDIRQVVATRLHTNKESVGDDAQ